MKNITQLRNSLLSGLFMVILLGVFSSCSSSKNAHYSDDGIYGTTPSQPQEEVVMVRDTRSDYYQNYFSGEKEIHEEIFTDIDAYQGYQDTDTVYVDDQYVGGNPPWEYSNSNVSVNFSLGFGGGWGWGYPGWGAGWGWGYPGWGWGPGWGYPGWGWGPGWGYYPPYYGHYTYGRRYAHNTSRLNTRGVYNERTLSSRYNRSSSNYDRRLASSNYSRGRYPSSARNLNRSYQRSTGTRSSSRYNRSTNRGSNSKYYNRSAPRSRSYRGTRSSSGMSRGGMSRGGMSRGGMSRGGMSRSSGRRNLSYIDLDNSSYGSNRTFVKRNTGIKDVAARNGRISYSKARSNPNYQRAIRTNPAVSRGNSGSYRGGTYGNVRSSSARSSSGKSNSSSRSRSYSRSSSRSSSGSSYRSSSGGSRSSGVSRSGGSGRSSSRNR